MLKQYFNQWASRRFQIEATKNLKQRDILIFIYQQGYLYLVLILITFIAGINYANNLILGFCFLISSILCLSFYLTFKQLHQLEVTIVMPEVGRVDEALKVQVHFRQSRVTPRFIYLQDAEINSSSQIQNNAQSETKPLLHQDHAIALVSPLQHIELEFIPLKRGQWRLPNFRLFSTYPFGLVRAWTYFYCQQQVWVAPKPQRAEFEYDAAQSLGQPDHDEFRELRAYKFGDSLQKVSWKQAARGQGLYVKEFEDQKDMQTLHIDYQQMPSTEHEQKLSLMMGLVYECEMKHIPYRLSLDQCVLEAGVGEKQYVAAQLILAQVD